MIHFPAIGQYFGNGKSIFDELPDLIFIDIFEEI